jgi:hypothetical protein
MIEVTVTVQPDGEVRVIEARGLGNNEALWAELNGILGMEYGWDRDHMPQAAADQIASLMDHLTETYLPLDFTVVVYEGKSEVHRFEHRVSQAQPEVGPTAERVSRYQREPVI